VLDKMIEIVQVMCKDVCQCVK